MSHVPEPLKSGQTVVVTAGHPVRLVDQYDGTAQRVAIHVLPTNTTGGKVYVGGPEVYAGEGGDTGYRGEPLLNRTDGPDSWVWGPIDPTMIRVDADTSGDGVSWTIYR